MELIVDVGHLECRFFPFGDNANLDTKLVHRLRRTYRRLGHRFGRTRQNSYETWVVWNLTSSRLETVLVPMQDRCMVCARRTIGLAIVLDALDGTTR